MTIKEARNAAEKKVIIEAFNEAGNWSAAARLLNISRRSLAYLCKKHGLTKETCVAQESTT